MKILAIDLGDTSGYVMIRRQPTHLGDRADLQTVYANVLLAHGIFPIDGTLPKYIVEDEPDTVVIERPAYRASDPSQKQSRYSNAVVSLVLAFGEKCEVIRPTDWKQRFSRYPLPWRGALRTQHEKDAWRMAAWTADKYGGQK